MVRGQKRGVDDWVDEIVDASGNSIVGPFQYNGQWWTHVPGAVSDNPDDYIDPNTEYVWRNMGMDLRPRMTNGVSAVPFDDYMRYFNTTPGAHRSYFGEVAPFLLAAGGGALASALAPGAMVADAAGMGGAALESAAPWAYSASGAAAPSSLEIGINTVPDWATAPAVESATAADPIEAIYQAMQQTGAGTATEAANALGYKTVEGMLGTMNPAWLSGAGLLTAAGLGSAAGSAAGGALKYLADGASNVMNGDVLSGLGDIGKATASVAPSLAAINYARNQDPFNTSNLQSLYSQTPTNYQFDTSKLNAAYDAFDPNSVTKQYDLNTGQGRGALADSLAARGVGGSSFGTMDMTNYGVQRDAGRQSLINDAIMKRAGIADTLLSNDRQTAALNLQGLGAKAGLANSILGADVKDREMRNNLYGRALLALSGGLTPSKSLLWGN